MAPSISTNNPNPLDVFDFVVNQGQGVKGLSELGLKSLPSQYIQPLEERFDANIAEDLSPYQVIDMDDPKVAKAVCDAAQKWGFFQIVNHGVPIHVLEDVKEATHQFFGLSVEEKLKYSEGRSVSNNIRYGTSFTPGANKPLEWKDYLSIDFMWRDEAASLWPPNCGNQALAYIENSEILIKKLLEILMNGLNVKEIDESKESILMGTKRLKFNYYPKCPNPELAAGAVCHSDAGIITILLQDDVGGLYVRNPDTMKWIHVPPVGGSLVIFVGDALQIISNGKYKSVEHRVSANGSNDRISVPIFVSPRPNEIIGPLPEVLKSGEKALYKYESYLAYVKSVFRKAHGCEIEKVCNLKS